MNVLRRAAAAACVASGALMVAGHVGSPDTYFEGVAGPYPVRVIIRAPAVIPARAEVIVRVAGSGVTSVTAAPYIWNGGDRSAPPPDQLVRVAGDSTLWTDQLWIMQSGSYSVRVTVSGAAGKGVAVVPYAAVATAVLSMDPRMGVGLAAFGLFLVAGLITIVGAASRESTLEPGEEPDAARRRTSWVVRGVATAIVITLLVLGRVWWNADNAAYARGIYQNVEGAVSVRDSAGIRLLAFTVDSEVFVSRRWAPMIPDHGKLMHLFAVREDLGAMAHLHPRALDSLRFVGTLPGVPAGRYRVFADIVRESGFAETMVGRVEVTSAPGATKASDPDDATFTGAASGDVARLPDGSTLTWERGTAPLVAGAEAPLLFALRDAKGADLTVEPFLGMAAHAAVVRDSLDVFVHLHPVGTTSMAAQQALMARTDADTGRGDVARRLAAMAQASTGMRGMLHEAALPGRFAFPYAFPREGRYRVWVQFRRRGAITTVPFDMQVGAAKVAG